MIGIGFITRTLIDMGIKFKYTTGTGVLQKRKRIVIPFHGLSVQPLLECRNTFPAYYNVIIFCPACQYYF